MLHPCQIAKSGSEDAHQAALFCWVHHHVAIAPELELLFAIPNGGARSAATAARLKATGVKSGVSDMFLPVPRWGRWGLWIELKKLKGGRESVEQKAWGQAMREQGFAYCCCMGWREAAKALMAWLEFIERPWHDGSSYDE